MAFNGYLLKVPNKSTFPHKYIALDSYSTTPNQREELKAFRDDDTRTLHRITASGMKTVFSFKTIDGLNQTQKEEIDAFFTVAYGTDGQQERKCHLTYWNVENNTYKTSYFYVSNTPYKIKSIKSNDIIYGEIEYNFVEY